VSADELLFDRRGSVQWITFNRPDARNALTWAMYDGLEKACKDLNADRAIQALVLTGAGKAFVAGTDISQFGDLRTAADVLAYEARGREVMEAIEAVRVPTIAAISGACTGAGAVIATACDVRIGAPSARFGFPIARTLGNCLSMSNYARVAAVAGMSRLKELILRARLMEAQEMLETGILAELTPDERSLPQRAQQVAEEMAANAPLTLWATKETYRRLRDRLIPEAADRDLIVKCYLSRDFREGVQAFLEKRDPRWTGE
jgi:enoyl-CoA hydratase/carnithine racemase